MKPKLFLFILLAIPINLVYSQVSYFENFDKAGYPTDMPFNSYWIYYNEIYPEQNTWNQFIPGDGFAYLKVDADTSNDTDLVHPYQTLVFGGAYENHRLEVRMKGAVVDGGLVAFLFTYTQTGSLFNEVDIEVVAQDRDAPPHEVMPPNGYTDARFNTWRDADEDTALPQSGSAKAVINQDNEKISLMDDEFHTYTIEWRFDSVDFFIDNVLQESFDTNIAKGWAEIIIGYRNLPWAGDFKWTGTHTLVIDYFKIEPLGMRSSLSTDGHNDNNQKLLDIYPNPANNILNIRNPDNHQIKNIKLINILSATLIQIEGFNNKIDISTYPKGIYFLKAEFENGNTIIKKILKL